MKKEDKSFIISLLEKHEMVVLGVMVTFFTWIVVSLFNLKEAQAVQESKVDAIKETVDKIYVAVKK